MNLFYTRVLVVLSFAPLLLLMGCTNIVPHADSHSHSEHNTGTHSNDGHEQTSSTIHIHNQWVRAVPPVSHTSAAYMSLVNHGSTDDQLIGITTSIVEAVEIHNVKKENGMMTMYPVEFVDLPAGGTLKFKPGGYHVMLIGLKKPLKVGDEVNLMLHFKHTDMVKIKAPVREGMPMKHKH